MMHDHGGWYFGAHHASGWGRGLLLLLLVLALAAGVTAVVLLVRQRGVSGATSGPAPAAPPGYGGVAALQILDERFARGEIDDEEYQRRRSVLLAAR